MEIEQEIIGFSGEGEVLIRYTLTNDAGAKVTLLNIGAAVESVSLPEKGELILSYPSYKEYMNDSLLMGKCVGRAAGRIAKSRVVIDGEVYKLSSNEGMAHLNGGVQSFGHKLWQARSERDMVVFSYVSAANEEGYPAEFGLEVGYTLSDDSTLGVTIVGEADSDTIANVAPFLYFTLGKDVQLKINSTEYVPLDAKLLPKGEMCGVEGTDYDYRTFRSVGSEIDDYWMINDFRSGVLNDCCTLRSLVKGVEVEIRSSQPALYVSSCSSIEGCGVDKNGEELENECAVLLSPMAVANGSSETIILRVGQKYHHYTTYNFKNR